MSLANAIRAAMGGRSMKSRIEEEDPENIEEDPDKEVEGEEEQNPDAEDDDPDKVAEGDEEENPDAEDDEGEEKKLSAKDRKTFARGRHAERRRIAAILGSSHGEASPKLAAHLAFGTGMGAKQALAALKASDAPVAGSSLAARMAAHKQPKLGGGGSKTDQRSATVAGVKAAVQALHPRK